MITEKELLDNGFRNTDSWNGRKYYSKNGFEIVDHNGLYRCDGNNWSGYGKEIRTIEDLNDKFNKYVLKMIKSLEKTIKIKTDELNRFKTLVNL